MSQNKLFNLCASPRSERALSRDFSDIAAYVRHLKSDEGCTRTSEFEWAIESVLRNNGNNPELDTAWREAGFAGGRSEAVAIVCEGYKKSVPHFMELLATNVKYNAYDYVRYNPDQIDSFSRHRYGPSALERAVRAVERANLETDRDIQTDDAAWIEVGIEGGLAGLRAKVHDIFVAGKVGGYLAGQLKDGHKFNIDELSRGCADNLLITLMPRTAEKLGIANFVPSTPSTSAKIEAGTRTTAPV
ncbi:MAG: hypothetical protein WC043_08245 [Pseudobdellovibrionaceae bacterium]